MLERAENDRISPNGFLSVMAMLLAGLVLLQPGFSPAYGQQESGLYVVHGIEIDERAESELAAKQVGVQKAKRRGLKQLIDRLTINGWAQGMAGIHADRLEFLIRDIAFTEEKFGGGRYLATVAIRFREEAVSETLEREGIAYVGMPSRPLTVVPIYREGNFASLWSELNPWLGVWSEIARTSGLVPLTVPLGDLSDIATLDVNQAYSGDQDALLALASRYGTGGVLVAIASPPVEEGGTVSIAVTAYGPGWDGRQFSFAYRPAEGESVADGSALQAAAHAVVGELETIWKEENLLRFDQDTREIGVTVPLSGLEYWLSVRKTLDRTAPIKQWRLEELSTKVARIRVGFVGAPDRLNFALAQGGLQLVAPPYQTRPSGYHVYGEPSPGSTDTNEGGSVITDTSVLDAQPQPSSGTVSAEEIDPYPWKLISRGS